MVTWDRLNRRFPMQQPAKRRVRDGIIVVCIDTSGSVDDQLLSRFLGEISALTQVGGLTTYLISCDAKVHQVIEPGEPIPDKWLGGGGTDFRPAIEKAEMLSPDAVVYLTDGEGTYPAKCDIPLLWAFSTRRAVSPLGESLYLGE